MHLKRVIKKIMALGLGLCLCMTNLPIAYATNATEGIETKIENDLPDDEGETIPDTNEKDKQEEKQESEPEKDNKSESDEKSEDNILDSKSEKKESQADVVDKEVKDADRENADIQLYTWKKAEFTDETETTYIFELSNCQLEKGESLKAAVWSSANKQADLKWIVLEEKEKDVYGGIITISDYKSAGEFEIHIYRKMKDGTEQIVAGTKFYVTEISSGKVKIQEQNYENGTAQIRISDVKAPSGVKKVKAAVWSDAKQKDIYWYEAVKKSDGWYIDIDISKYHTNNWGEYITHFYATDGNGFEKYVGGIRIDFSLKAVPLNVEIDKEARTATIEMSADELKIPGKFKNIRCAVWSNASDQRDLKWYDLEYSAFTKKWSKTFSLTMLKNTGICYAHAYVSDEYGNETFLNGTSFVVSGPSLKSVDIDLNNKEGEFEIVLEDLKTPYGCEKVEVAVWSQGDQGDLIWYQGLQQQDGSYTVKSDISQHKYNVGQYYVHVYVTDKLNIRTCVKCTTMEFKSSIGKLSVTDDPKETLYTVSLSVDEYPAGLKGIKFGVWSNHNGQDDLKWYEATKSGNTYQAEIDIKNHRTSGTYSVHAYGINQAGYQVFLAGHGELINIKGTAKGGLSVTEKNESVGTFKAVISDLDAPAGIYSVKLGVWNQEDQSDLYWYTCKKESDEKWIANIDISHHKYHSGNYNLHVYTTMGNQIQTFTAGTTCKFVPSMTSFVLNDQGTGKRTLGVTNPTQTDNLRFAVWSENGGQDDLVWYTAKKAEAGTWKATFLGKNHKHGGTFNMHVYAGSTCIQTNTFYVPAEEVAKNGWYYEQRNGKTYKLYYVDDKLQTNVSSIIGRQSSYMAEVNRVTCTVTIYAKDGGNGYIIPVIAFTCSVGLPSTPTPLGTYNTVAKYRWHELMGPSYGQYCTRIVHGILFHSVAGNNMTSYNLSAAEYNKLGSPASHGCVRLCVRDAKWIYDNCSLGMEVRIFDNNYPGPFGKPATIKIPASQNWDPTDPNV